MKQTMKITIPFLAFALLAGCNALFPSPHTEGADYVMKHGKLQKVSKPGAAAPDQQTALATQTTKPAVATIPASYGQIAYPTFQYVAPYPKDFRVAITDSITGYLVPDRSLPFVRLNIYFNETTLPQAPDQAASIAILSPMFRKGGSVKIAPTVLDDSLELLAAGIGGDLGAFNSVLSLNCLSRDFSTTLALLEEVFTKPAFDSTRLELQKTIYLQNLLHKYDRPPELLAGLSRWAMYQSGPRMWNAKPEEVKKIHAADLGKLAQNRFATGRIIFAVSGDFDSDTMKTALRGLFSHLPQKPSTPQARQTLVFKNKPGIYLSDKVATQAQVSLEQPFVQRPHADYYATSVASYILGGGGFTSRLTLRIRSDEGLAYSVNSSAGSDYQEVSTTEVNLQTKVSTAAYAIKLIREEIQKLAEQGPTAEEMESAKLSLIESLPGIFDSPASTADAFARSETWGRSFDHFKNYPAEIRAVTPEDVKRCIAKYFSVDKMTISVVGPVAELQKRDEIHGVSLSDFGKIQIIPVDSLEMR
jgi:zinc protease